MFADHLGRASREALETIPADEAYDVYAVLFLLLLESDNHRQPALCIGYNTESWLTNSAADRREDRWDIEQWPDRELARLGDRVHDPTGAKARAQWVREEGLWLEYPKPKNFGEESALWDEIGARGQEIWRRFGELCARVARELHDDGVIERVFGDPVPIVVHDPEDYDGHNARWTEAANPPGLASAYVNRHRDW